MNQQLLDTLIALLLRRGLTWLAQILGITVAVSDDQLAKWAGAAGSLLLFVGNEWWQARKFHQTAKEQGGIIPPVK